MGVSAKAELVPLDKLTQQYDFNPPRGKGFKTVEACVGILAGKVNAFIGLFAASVAFCLAAVAVLVAGKVITAIIIVFTGFITKISADHFVRPSLTGGTTKSPFI